MKSINIDLGEGDALIIVPPFATIDKPSLGVHILQACAKSAGISVKILYANIILASEIGENNYLDFINMNPGTFMREGFFASVAYDISPDGKEDYYDNMDILELKCGSEDSFPRIAFSKLRNSEKIAAEWVNSIGELVARSNFKVVGCTTTFEQTAASIALLNRIKQMRHDIITIIGGANCQGEMAEGILSLGADIDYIFSGESEYSFPQFLKTIKEKKYPVEKIIYGKPCTDLDGIPLPDYTDFYDQLKLWLPNSFIAKNGNIWMPYESSRGCWWGQMHQCTFCGLNGETINFRQKSPGRVIYELKELLRNHPTKNILMTDNIMPFSYFKTLLPQLSRELPRVHIFYEIKANLSLKNIVALKKAGVDIIQPGIESLSTHCLKLMNKGGSARKNIALLRYARSIGLAINWNLLYGIPGDLLIEYQNMLTMLPLLRHLRPPASLLQLSIERYSPYFDQPGKYGISNIHPLEMYSSILPKCADISKIAWHFAADYESESRENKDIIHKLELEIEKWRSLWRDDMLPTLAVFDVGDDHYLLIDTRGLPGTEEINIITRNQASLILAGLNFEAGDELVWAQERKLILEVDSKYVPLATAEPGLICRFEREMKASCSSSINLKYGA